MKMSKIKPFDQEKSNPCLKEQNMTFKCFNDNNYDKEKCKTHMENYKNCKSFWSHVQSTRRRQGIAPNLPPVEEREKVKQEFIEMLKNR